MTHDTIHVRWSIKWKLMGVLAGILVSLVIILTSIQIAAQKTVLEEELEKRIALMQENLIERGKSFITNLSRQVENDIASFNFSGLLETVQASVDNAQELQYAILVEASGIAFIHTLQPELTQSELQTDRDRLALEQRELAVFHYKEAGEPVIEIVHPLQISTVPWGVLRLVYTLHELTQEIRSSRLQIQQKIRHIVSKSILTSCGFLLLTGVLVFILTTRISQPLIRLTHAARTLSRGDFSDAAMLTIRSKDELGVLAASFTQMGRDLKDSYEQLEDYSHTLEQKVAERTEALHLSLQQVENANQKIMESIQYAKMIQRSLLPNEHLIRSRLPQSFFLWMPRDVVGGDIFFAEFFPESFIIAVLDCTGHGVPGAFMTMIASSALQRIVRDESCHNPGAILQRLNVLVKTSLQQDKDYATSDDGLDAAICLVQPGQRLLTFAGARLSLFFTRNDGLEQLKGDRQSLGYKRSDLDFTYRNQSLLFEEGMSIYLSTDGFPDQLGGRNLRRFGARRFQQLLYESSQRPFHQQQEFLLEAFHRHRGAGERQDDVTVVGFGFNAHEEGG